METFDYHLMVSLHTSQAVPTTHAPVQVSVPLPGGFNPPLQTQAPDTMTTSKASSGFDLFGDFGSDPFASSSTSSNTNGNGMFVRSLSLFLFVYKFSHNKENKC